MDRESLKVEKEGRYDLIPHEWLTNLAIILQKGCQKYGDENWKTGLNDGNDSTFFDSGLRHIVKYRRGETNDNESGIHHLYHAAINMLMAAWRDEERKNG